MLEQHLPFVWPSTGPSLSRLDIFMSLNFVNIGSGESSRKINISSSGSTFPLKATANFLLPMPNHEIFIKIPRRFEIIIRI